MIVLHQVNCMGVMGAGFAKYVRNTFPDCYTQYKEHCSKPNVMLLGTFTTYTKGNCTIINMFSQLSYGRSKTHTDYAAMESALIKIRQAYPTQEIIAPYKIGCGLGGGDWNIVSTLLKKYNIKISENIKLEA